MMAAVKTIDDEMRFES